MTLTFTGTRLSWIATKGTTTGQADVYVDGAFKTTVDLAAAAASYQQEVWSTGDLTNAVHTVKIVRSSASASGKYLTIDAVDVVGTLLGGGEDRAGGCPSCVRRHLVGRFAPPELRGAATGEATGSGAAVYVDFTGVEARLDRHTGPGMGKAWVSRRRRRRTERRPVAAGTTAYKQKVWDSGPLTLGDHEVKIWWDTSNASGKYITRMRSTCWEA